MLRCISASIGLVGDLSRKLVFILVASFVVFEANARV